MIIEFKEWKNLYIKEEHVQTQSTRPSFWRASQNLRSRTSTMKEQRPGSDQQGKQMS